MEIEVVDIFHNNKFYSTERIELGSYSKVKKDVEVVWGLDSDKVELVCYDYEEFKHFSQYNKPIKTTKDKKETKLSDNYKLILYPKYIK